MKHQLNMKRGVLMAMYGDSGPTGGFCRADHEHDTMRHGFGSCTFFAPADLVEEYEALTARIETIEEQFGRLEDAQRKARREAGEGQP